MDPYKFLRQGYGCIIIIVEKIHQRLQSNYLDLYLWARQTKVSECLRSKLELCQSRRLDRYGIPMSNSIWAFTNLQFPKAILHSKAAIDYDSHKKQVTHSIKSYNVSPEVNSYKNIISLKCSFLKIIIHI